MNGLILRAPSRLHFGLLSLNPEASRQFGGVGLMIEGPHLEITARPAADWGAHGPRADRVLGFAKLVASRLPPSRTAVQPLDFEILEAPPEHVGLGTGTQLGLAVARLVASFAGLSHAPFTSLAEWAGRGLRSGIGLHGAALGGLIVDGGRSSALGPPPLLFHSSLPDEWSILLAIPRNVQGLHGLDETRAFDRLPPIPTGVTDQLCRLVLMGLMPALVEHDLKTFGEALSEIQARVGQAFSPTQGGIFAHPRSASMVEAMRSEGLHGVGQSSWGPTLYGFADFDAIRRETVEFRLRNRLGFEVSLRWTKPSRQGVRMEPIPHS